MNSLLHAPMLLKAVLVLSVPQSTYLLGNRRISTEPVQQSITAYETGQVGFQKPQPTCRVGDALAITTQITNSAKMQLGAFLDENPDFFSVQHWAKKGKTQEVCMSNPSPER